ncbi:MAG TPA: hypothetical protein VMR52_00075 [Dehalococcoidia bacterium]|nr:hypothetical protein [Dehalococcoidia bacterium]
MTSRDLAILFFSWIGAVFIALGVYEWRQDNDLGSLGNRVSDLESGISSIGDREPDFEPQSSAADDLILTIVSSSGEDVTVPGVIEAPGSLVLRVTNAGAGSFSLSDLDILASTGDGAACQTLLDQTDSAGSVGPAQSDEARLLWDCENLAVLTVQGVEFRPVQ